jgi:hypothetical protein
MMNTKACFAATGLAIGSLVLAAPALADPVVFEATGEFPEDIQVKVEVPYHAIRNVREYGGVLAAEVEAVRRRGIMRREFIYPASFATR